MVMIWSRVGVTSKIIKLYFYNKVSNISLIRWFKTKNKFKLTDDRILLKYKV